MVRTWDMFRVIFFATKVDAQFVKQIGVGNDLVAVCLKCVIAAGAPNQYAVIGIECGHGLLPFIGE